jgi:CRISPR-associated protein Cas1
LGFVHTGKALSFVYDVADLYKATIVIPVAFRVSADGNSGTESRMRHLLRDKFFESRLLEKIVPDLALLTRWETATEEQEEDFDADDVLPSGLWDPEAGIVSGGVNHSHTEE